MGKRAQPSGPARVTASPARHDQAPTRVSGRQPPRWHGARNGPTGHRCSLTDVMVALYTRRCQKYPSPPSPLSLTGRGGAGPPYTLNSDCPPSTEGPGGVYSHRTVGGEERIRPPRGSTA